MSSKPRNEEEFPSEIKESKHELWCGHRDTLRHEFLSLVTIRDFLNLILIYPMTMPYQYLLGKWINDAQVLTTRYSEHIDFQRVEDLESEASLLMHLLSEKPLRYMEGFIPNDILSKIEDGQRFILNENEATLSEELVASASTSKRNELTDVHDVIPAAILNSAADLAVGQLIQTLLTSNIHHVRISTRNSTEKIDMMRKIYASVNDIQNRKKINHKYSGVLWIDVSNYGNKPEFGVQQEITRQFNLVMAREDMKDDKENFLSRCVEEEMMRMKHLVFLVDGDVNGKLDPQKVGFPKKTLAGVVVLITTESSTQENDEVTMAMDLEIRTEDHMLPWELFCRNVGLELVRSSAAIQRIAVQIVEECCGHLLAIVIVAKSLKNIKDVTLWDRALDKLRNPSPSYNISMFHGMSRVMVNAFTNIIWNSMNETEKLCLACCLNVFRIKDKIADHLLISIWVDHNLVFSQEEAEHILRDLLDSSVLLQLNGKYICLPEETYNALKLLLRLYHLDDIRQGGLGLTELPNISEWLGAQTIELMDNRLSELLPSPACPGLEVLLLQGNSDLMDIPPLFFALMPELLVLDLSNTSIRSLPSSLFDLKELRNLHLKGCRRFMELPPEIGQLKNLTILDLDGTPIKFLPEQIQELTKLRKLMLSFYAFHQSIDHDKESKQFLVPPRVISKLTQLSYLSIDVSTDDKQWDENLQVILKDIFRLKELRTLSLYFPQVKLLKQVPYRRNLDFSFVVGRHMQRIISRCAPPAVEEKFIQSNQNYCSLKLVNGVKIPKNASKGLQRTKTLFLEHDMTIKHLSEFERKNLQQLCVCVVGECNEMLTLVDAGLSYMYSFPNLQFLCAFYMSNLRSIGQGKASFGCLKTIALHTCPNLTTIVTSNFLDSLVQLEELIVEDCPKVSSLISLESFEPTERIFLARLRKVSLLYLPELVSISSGLHIGQSLERIGFYDCPKLQSLSTLKFSKETLKVIKAENQWWDALNWEEAEWGKEGRPAFLDAIYCPINEEADIVDQLVGDEYKSSTSNSKEIWADNLSNQLKWKHRCSESSSFHRKLKAISKSNVPYPTS